MSEENRYKDILEREQGFLLKLFEATADDEFVKDSVSHQLDELKGMAGLVGPAYTPYFGVKALHARLGLLLGEMESALGKD